MTLVITNEDVQQVLDMTDCINILETAYMELSEGRAENIPRSDLLAPTSQHGVYYGLKTMSGVIPKMGIGVIRLNSDIINWPVMNGIPRREKIPKAGSGKYVGLILLFNSENGELLAIIQDGIIQRMRVGATNGLAAKYLAHEDAKTIGILGSGWQAGGQLLAHCAVRKISTIKVFSPNQEHRNAFAEEMEKILGIEIKAVFSAEEAIEDADIIITATNVLKPIFPVEWVRDGIHVSSIKRPEIHTDAIKKFDLVVLNTKTAIKPANYVIKTQDFQIPGLSEGWWGRIDRDRDVIEKSYELIDLVSGKIKGRTSQDQSTCFINNIGMGIQFAAVSMKVYELAKKKELGKEIPTDWFLETVHP